MTKIPWTEETINPWVGCTKCATGCLNCYAEKRAWRLKCMGKPAYQNVLNDKHKWNGKIVRQPGQLEKVLRWREPRMVFLGSMSDIFHPAVPFEDIKKVWDIGVKCPQHTLQILTKRIERALEFTQWMAGRDDISIAEWPRNFWLGTSISTQADLEKVWQTMRDIPAAVKFYSYEPALEGIKFDLPYLGYIVSALEFIDQVIIGCESGQKQRPCETEWIRDAVRQCREAGVATFLKQMPINGKCNKHPKDWPKWARIQEYPK